MLELPATKRRAPFRFNLNENLVNLVPCRLPALREVNDAGAAVSGVVIAADIASEEIIGVASLSVRFLLSGPDTNGSVSVFEFTVPAGQKIPAMAHKNDAYEEVLYGIEGVLTWTIDGRTYEVGPGQAVCIPRGAVHRFDNFGTENAKQLVVITPAIMGPAYFRETRELLVEAAKTKTPPDVARMVDIFRRNGMTVAAPPAN